MDYSFLFLGLVPLIIFVIVDTFSGLKSALLSAIIFAIFEGVFSFYYFGHLDWITGCSILLVMALATTSWWFKKSIYFKFQPVLLSIVVAFLFLLTSWIEKPILLEIADKYSHLLPSESRHMLQMLSFRELIARTNHYMGYSMLLHAMVTAWSAIKLSNIWWLVMRGFGFYIFQFGAIVMARIIG